MEYSQHTRFGIWKLLPMAVYATYGLLVVHVNFGVLQSHGSAGYVVAVDLGHVTVLGSALRSVSL